MSEIETTEAETVIEVMDAEAPKPRKVAKKTVKSPANATEQARARVKAKLEQAKRPNKADMLSRLAHGD